MDNNKLLGGDRNDVADQSPKSSPISYYDTLRRLTRRDLVRDPDTLVWWRKTLPLWGAGE